MIIEKIEELDTKTVTGKELIRGARLIQLFDALGARIKIGTLNLDRHLGKGPPCVRFGREVWYRLDNARDYLQLKLGCTIREAIEAGRLTPPTWIGQLAWDSDGLPVEAKRAS